MARHVVFALGLVSLVSASAGGAGCSSTNSNVCSGASAKLIQASDYDQSCKVDTDCWQIAEGNACAPCAFSCRLGGAINVAAMAQYNSDTANTPAVAVEFNGRGCIEACPAAPGSPCCIGGMCQTNEQCPQPMSSMTCALGAACSTTDICPGGVTDCGFNCQCLNGTWSTPCPAGLPPNGGACVPVGAECGYPTSTNACGAENCSCESGGTWSCGPSCAVDGDASADAETDADGESGACTVDSAEIACCCRGDVGGNGPFCRGGSLSCATGFGLYFGADCTRECGPCAIACPDSGTSGADSGMDGTTEGGTLDAGRE